MQASGVGQDDKDPPFLDALNTYVPNLYAPVVSGYDQHWHSRAAQS